MKVFFALALFGIIINAVVVMTSGEALSGFERQLKAPKNGKPVTGFQVPIDTRLR